MNVNSPEVFLKSFNNRILHLLNSTEILKNSKIRTELRLLYRKLFISEILFEKYIISISGLQGVGKTTLLKQIYSIPDEILPENLGRGEQLPVLVTESDVSVIGLYVTRLKEDSEKQQIAVKQSIDKEEFFRISKNPKSTELILEIKVPNKIFNTEERSFLLLPGFENENNWREDLVSHSLISSATCLFLFNEAEFADERNTKILNRINTEFESGKPIFIASFSDTSKDENRTLKKDLIEKFNLQNEEDRVICIGTGKIEGTEKDRIEMWLPELNKSLSKYSHTTSQFRNSQMENLRNIIEGELGDILESIEDAKDSSDFEIDLTELKAHKDLKLLNNQIKYIKEQYLDVLNKRLADFAVKPKGEFNGKILKKGFLKKLERQVFGNTLKESIKFEEEISKCWNESNDYGLNELHAVVLNELLSTEIKFYKQLSLEPSAGQKALLGNFNQPKETEFLICNDNVDDIKKLFHPKLDKEVSPKFSDQYNKSIEVLPLLFLEFLRISTISTIKEVGDGVDNQKLPENGEISNILKFAKDFKPNSELILPGIAALFGIDAMDGKIDTLTAVGNSLGISATALANSILIGAGVVGAGILVKNTITEINKTDIKDAKMASHIIDGIKDRCIADYKKNFEKVMDELTRFVRIKFSERYHLDKKFSRHEYLLKTIADVREDRYNFKQLLNRQVVL